uniref:Uncharacterized protein n=1 Tax=Arundo donax TaxID=35708 RepID=A0A0A9HD09_ARUDO
MSIDDSSRFGQTQWLRNVETSKINTGKRTVPLPPHHNHNFFE